MSSSYDLHSHSTASDGTLTPTALVQRAYAQGVRHLALTDHDETAGLAEAMGAAQGLGMELIPGVEISVSWAKRTIHVVGLGIDPAQPQLAEGLAGLREFRDWRGAEMGRRLERKGIAGIYAEAQALCQGKILSRTHFGRALIARGLAQNVGDAIKRYLKPGKAGHVAGDWAELEQALAWVADAGGVAVLAHPLRYDLTATKLRALLGEFVECGGLGMEVANGQMRPGELSYAVELAQRFGLRGSLGSDFHSPDNPWVELGRLPELPQTLDPIWGLWRGAGEPLRRAGV